MKLKDEQLYRKGTYNTSQGLQIDTVKQELAGIPDIQQCIRITKQEGEHT